MELISGLMELIRAVRRFTLAVVAQVGLAQLPSCPLGDFPQFIQECFFHVEMQCLQHTRAPEAEAAVIAVFDQRALGYRALGFTAPVTQVLTIGQFGHKGDVLAGITYGFNVGGYFGVGQSSSFR